MIFDKDRHPFDVLLDWRRPRGCADNACPEVAVRDSDVFVRSSERKERIARLSVDEMRVLAAGWVRGDFDDLLEEAAAESTSRTETN